MPIVFDNTAVGLRFTKAMLRASQSRPGFEISFHDTFKLKCESRFLERHSKA